MNGEPLCHDEFQTHMSLILETHPNSKWPSQLETIEINTVYQEGFQKSPRICLINLKIYFKRERGEAITFFA